MLQVLISPWIALTYIQLISWKSTFWTGIMSSWDKQQSLANFVQVQRNPWVYQQGLGRVQISTMCVKQNLLVAGGFQGEMVCKVSSIGTLHQQFEYWIASMSCFRQVRVIVHYWESFEPNNDHYNLVSKYPAFVIKLFDWRLVKWTLLSIHKHDGFNLIRIWTVLEYRIVQKLPMMKVPSPMLLTSTTITGSVSGWDLVHTYICHKLNQSLVRFSVSRSMCHSGLLSSGM